MGGVGQYRLTLNNNETSFPIKDLGTGIYEVQMTDLNGCRTSVADTLRSLEIPEISGDSLYQILLGDSISFEIYSSVEPMKVEWTPLVDLTSPDQLQTFARPVQSRIYEVSVSSKDGCIRKYNVAVNVEKRRSFVISNGVVQTEGSNHRLRYFAGPDVAGIQKYAVYDRWGSKVFDAENLPAGVIDLPWDLTFRGKAVMAGVYTWMAEVSYIDGEVVRYTGGLTILE